MMFTALVVETTRRTRAARTRAARTMMAVMRSWTMLATKWRASMRKGTTMRR
jgi:hypothetical protein